MRFERMTQWFVQVDLVAIAATLAMLRKNIRLFQMLNNAGCRAFRDANLISDVSHPCFRVIRQTHQYVRVIAEKCPRPAVFLLF